MQFIQYFNELTDGPAGLPGRRPGQRHRQRRRSTAARWATSSGSGTTSSWPRPGTTPRRSPWPAAWSSSPATPTQLFGLAGDDPTLVVNAADEMHPVDLAGAPLPALRHRADRRSAASTSPRAAGCCCRYPSANRDEDVFADPMTLRRAPARRRQAAVSFGVGAHFCLGAQFARRELRTMLDRLSQRARPTSSWPATPEWARVHFVSRREAPADRLPPCADPAAGGMGSEVTGRAAIARPRDARRG